MNQNNHSNITGTESPLKNVAQSLQQPNELNQQYLHILVQQLKTAPTTTEKN